MSWGVERESSTVIWDNEGPREKPMDSQSPSTILIDPGAPIQIATGTHGECQYMMMSPTKWKTSLGVWRQTVGNQIVKNDCPH